VREASEATHADRLEGADGHPAVCLVAGAVRHRHVVPGQPFAAAQERGLVGLDGEPVVPLLDGDQDGSSNRAIAEKPVVTVDTVKSQVTHILAGSAWPVAPRPSPGPTNWTAPVGLPVVRVSCPGRGLYSRCGCA
jgi:hypothetical protein